MNEQTTEEATEATEETPGATEAAGGTANAPEALSGTGIPGGPSAGEGTDSVTTDDDPETFPREYVVRLRQEAADNRVRASDRDALAERLHTSLVAASGRLADPSDLAFDDAHLESPEALTAAIDDLLTRKPHLASRRVVGDVGQGVVGSGETVDLAGMLRARA